ncbi:MAG: VCBS repeat-containing protein [Myxococcota bacterium]
MSMLRAALWAGLTLAPFSLGGSGCVDRVIHETLRCGDGVVDPGEVCLGRGEPHTLTFDGLEGASLRIASFDGDPHLDLLLSGLDPEGAVVARLWVGHGDGTFEPPIDPGLTGCRPTMTSGTLDDDTAADVLIDGCGGSLLVFPGSSGPGLGIPTALSMEVELRAFGIADLDADGRREVVALGLDAAGRVALNVAERQAGGDFAPLKINLLADSTEDFDPRSLSLFDLDRDAQADALLIDPDHRVALARGQPGLGFGPPEPVGPPMLTLTTALVHDLDDDSVPDVLAASAEQEALIFLQAIDGRLVETGRTSIPQLRTGPAGVGDIDNDDRTDLLLFEPGTRRLQAWFGRGDGSFEAPQDVPIDARVDRIGLADLDEDGVLDIVAGTFQTGTIQILLGDP